jgi:hypothetical protein
VARWFLLVAAPILCNPFFCVFWVSPLFLYGFGVVSHTLVFDTTYVFFDLYSCFSSCVSLLPVHLLQKQAVLDVLIILYSLPYDTLNYIQPKSRLAVGPTQSALTGVPRPGREAARSPISFVDVKSERSHTPSPPHA